MLGHLISGLGDTLLHLGEDMNTALFGLGKGFAHDLPINSIDLNIHLQRGNAFTGSDYLEIHITEMIFIAEDIGKNNDLVAFLNQDPWRYRTPDFSREPRHPS